MATTSRPTTGRAFATAFAKALRCSLRWASMAVMRALLRSLLEMPMCCSGRPLLSLMKHNPFPELTSELESTGPRRPAISGFVAFESPSLKASQMTGNVRSLRDHLFRSLSPLASGDRTSGPRNLSSGSQPNDRTFPVFAMSRGPETGPTTDFRSRTPAFPG